MEQNVPADGIQPATDDEFHDTTDTPVNANGGEEFYDEPNPLSRDEDDAETHELPEEDEEEEKPVKQFKQDEVDEIIKKRLAKQERKFQRQMEEMRAQLKGGEKSPSVETPVKESPAKDAPKAPKREDFQYLEDFLQADSDYKLEQKFAALKQELSKKDEEKSEKAAQEAEAKKWAKMQEDRVSSGRKEYADFDAVINAGAKEGIIDPKTPLFGAIIESDIGHKVAYYLCQEDNVDEAERLLALPPRQLLREFGKLEAKLEMAEKEKTPPRRAAMKPVDGRHSKSMDDPVGSPNMSTDDFIRRRNKQEFGRDYR